MGAPERAPRFWWGFVAGVAGGVAGTAVKVLAEKVYPPRVTGEPPLPHGVTAERTASKRLEGEQREKPAHWGFGALAGGVYGMLAEVWPQVTEGNGAAFGLALELVTHESALPMIGLAPPQELPSGPAQASRLSTNAVYGMTAEYVRKHVRAWLEDKENADAERGPQQGRLPLRGHVNFRQTA